MKPPPLPANYCGLVRAPGLRKEATRHRSGREEGRRAAGGGGPADLRRPVAERVRAGATSAAVLGSARSVVPQTCSSSRKRSEAKTRCAVRSRTSVAARARGPAADVTIKRSSMESAAASSSDAGRLCEGECSRGAACANAGDGAAQASGGAGGQR